MNDYATICLALSITGAAWWIITDWFERQLYKDYLRQLTRVDIEEMVRIFK